MFLGGGEVAAVRLGDKEVVAAYLGSTLVWTSGVRLAGALLATTALSGVAAVARALSGSITVASSLAGAAAVSRGLAGAITASSSLSGDIDVFDQTILTGTIAAASVLSGEMVVARAMTAAAAALSSIAGAASINRVLAGTVAAVSSLSGAVTVQHPAATRTFINTYNSETDGTQYTVVGASFSTAGSTRAIVVAVMNRVSAGTGSTPSSVTVGGVSASFVGVQAATSDRNAASLWIAAVPSGTSGDIVVNFGATQQRCGIAWWATYNLSSLTPIAVNKSDVSGAAIGVNTQAGGLVFGTGNAGTTASTTFTWTGITEDFDIAVGTGNGWFTGASAETAAGSTPLAITCTGSGTPGGDQYLTASFR